MNSIFTSLCANHQIKIDYCIFHILNILGKFHEILIELLKLWKKIILNLVNMLQRWKFIDSFLKSFHCKLTFFCLIKILYINWDFFYWRWTIFLHLLYFMKSIFVNIYFILLIFILFFLSFFCLKKFFIDFLKSFFMRTDIF